MADKKQKCPICGTKLKMINGQMTCSECGYYIRKQSSSDTSAAPHNTSAPTQRNTATPPRYVSTPQSYMADKQTNNSYKPNSKGVHKGIIIGIVAAVVTTVVAVFASVFTAVVNSGSLDSISQLYSNIREAESSAYTTTQSTTHGHRTSQGAESDDIQTDYNITSTFFKEMVKSIFDKPFYKITDEDLARITFLQIDMDDQTISYQLDHAKSSHLTFDSITDVDWSDLRCFPNLEYLYLEDRDLDQGDLDGLENLHSIYTDNTLSELADIVPNPDNILELGVEDSYYESTLNGLKYFPNLQYLTVDCYDLEDISALNECPTLRGLTLIDCDSVTDYSPLMSLTNLEELRIRSRELKTIDFIEAMPNLEVLSIEDSKIDSLDALSGCPDLTVLYLEDNYQIKDYSLLGELTQLTDLTLYKGSSEDPLPSLENLTQLQNLTLGNVGSFEALPSSENMRLFYLDNCRIRNMDALTTMPNLNSLSLVNCRFDGDSLEPLTQMPLVYLNLERSYIDGNVEGIFGIPTLQYLTLDEFHGVINFDSMSDNESLLALSMNEFYIYINAPYVNERTTLSDHYELFDHFPNLETLYVESMDIDNLDFVEKLPNLRYLDITDNNVTSLKPLESLSNLRTVWCGKNTISESVSADSDILIYTEETPD